MQGWHPVSQTIISCHSQVDWALADTNINDIMQLREEYRCPHFRILVIGRANAGKTTILEKVCGVGKGTKPIIINDKEGRLDETPIYFVIFSTIYVGEELAPSKKHLKPSIEVSLVDGELCMCSMIDGINFSERHTQY